MRSFKWLDLQLRRRLVGMCLTLLSVTAANGQTPGTIVTIAGASPLGDGGLALRATLKHPYDVAKDPFGNLYVSGDQIRKIVPDGRIFTAVDTPAPYLATDPQGNVFFLTSTQLKKLDPQGNVTTIADVNGSGLAVDSGSSSYVSDATANRLYKITPDGTKTVLAGGGFELGDDGPATQARLKSPDAVAVDSQGSVYFVDAGVNRIRKVDDNGIIKTVVNDTHLIDTFYNHRLGFDPADRLYYSTGNTNVDTFYRVGQGKLLPVETCCFIGSFIFESANVLTFVDYSARWVRQMNLDPDGTVTGLNTTLAGRGNSDFGDDGPAIYAPVYPLGLAIDPSGNLIFLSAINSDVHQLVGNLIRKIDSNGIITTRKNLSIGYQTPFFTMDRNGNFYVSNYIYPKPTQILRYSPDPSVNYPTGVIGGGDFTEDVPAPYNIVLV